RRQRDRPDGSAEEVGRQRGQGRRRQEVGGQEAGRAQGAREEKGARQKGRPGAETRVSRRGAASFDKLSMRGVGGGIEDPLTLSLSEGHAEPVGGCAPGGCRWS